MSPAFAINREAIYTVLIDDHRNRERSKRQCNQENIEGKRRLGITDSRDSAEQEQEKMKQQKEYEGMFCCYFFCSEHDIFVSTFKTMNLHASVSNAGQITVIVIDLE